MDDSADVVQQVLAAAAQENGEFDLPLSAERIKAMRAALVERRQLVLAFLVACACDLVCRCALLRDAVARARRRGPRQAMQGARHRQPLQANLTP